MNIKLCFIILFIIILFIITLFCIVFLGEFHWYGNKYPACRTYDMMMNIIIKTNHIKGTTPLNKNICYENLSIIHDVFKKFNVPFWLSEGTALGFFRENDFISWDDDVDIGVSYSYYNVFINDIFPVLKRKGFMLAEVKDNSRYIFFVLLRGGEKVDVDFVRFQEPDKGCMASNYGRKPCGPLHKHLKNFSKITIKGKDYNLPKLGYITMLYGKTWNKPLKNFKIRENFKINKKF